jgi:hypothetical protein
VSPRGTSGDASAAEHGHAGWDALSWLPVAILLGLIAFHGTKIVTLDDDPQRSGAFAMFATVDVGATRRIIATAATGDEQVRVHVPESLEKVSDELADTPSASSARELASALLDLEWRVQDGTASEGGSIRFDEIQVEVVGLRADGRTLRRYTLADGAAER